MALKNLIPPKPNFNWVTLPIDVEKLTEIHEEQINPGNQYGLGSKIPLTLPPEAADGRKVDCSGYVRWLLYWSALGSARIELPDGSVNQHDAIIASGFKLSTVNACFSRDDVVRIAFLSPEDGGGVGHVLIVTTARR